MTARQRIIEKLGTPAPWEAAAEGLLVLKERLERHIAALPYQFWPDVHKGLQIAIKEIDALLTEIAEGYSDNVLTALEQLRTYDLAAAFRSNGIEDPLASALAVQALPIVKAALRR